MVGDDELPSDVEEADQPKIKKEDEPAALKPEDKRDEEDPSEQPS